MTDKIEMVKQPITELDYTEPTNDSEVNQLQAACGQGHRAGMPGRHPPNLPANHRHIAMPTQSIPDTPHRACSERCHPSVTPL